MSLLNKKFDIVQTDATPLAHAALAEVLDVPGGVEVDANGTPVTDPARVIEAGTVVAMNTDGEAVKAESKDLSTPLNRELFFVVIDGNEDFSGRATQKLSCLQGGFKCRTQQFVDDPLLVPGAELSVASGADAGKFQLATAGDDLQRYGWVAKEGKTDDGLYVMLPQT